MENNIKQIPGLVEAFIFVLIVIIVTGPFVLVAYLLGASEQSMSLLAYVGAVVSFFVYRLWKLKRQRNTTVRLIFKGWKDSFLNFVSGPTKLLFKVALLIGIICLGIWLIVALGPIWIIAIATVLILLVLMNR
jgi:hypothetical protein